MDRQELDGAMPWQWLLGLHPPWVHWAFWLVWWITSSLGPIFLIAGLLSGSDEWWIGLVIYAISLVTMGIDWLMVRRIRRRRDGWVPWTPPRWLHSR